MRTRWQKLPQHRLRTGLSRHSFFCPAAKLKNCVVRSPDSVKRRREEAKLTLARLDADLAALGAPRAPPLDPVNGHQHAPFATMPDFGPRPSVGKLVSWFCITFPGSKAGEFVEFVLKKRPDLDARAVHSELYRQTKKAQTMRKDGERPNTRFYPRRASA